MATTVPPPSKRQKVLIAEKAKERQQDAIPDDLGSIRVQFFDQATGQSAGAPVSIPVADATVKNLELLLNTLQRNDVSERIPYRFTFLRNQKDPTTNETLEIPNDIYNTLLKPGLKTTEDSISLHYTPQAIFRVRAVSRCSSAIPGHGQAILATSFSPLSSSKLLTGSGDNTARIFDCDTGTPQYTLQGHTSWVLAVSWSPDATIIATGSKDNTVRLWSPDKGLALGGPLKGHTKWITSLVWEPFHLQAPDRPRLASASKDTTVRIWNASTKRIETVLSGHTGSVSCVRWSGRGDIYTSSHDKSIKIWDPESGRCLRTLSAHAHWVNHLALSADHTLRTAYHDHTGIVPPTHLERVAKARERYEQVAAINDVLVSASDDYTMYLWPLSPSSEKETTKTTIKPIARLLGHQKPINHVTFSPSTLIIASSSYDNSIKLWSSTNGTFITTLRGHVGPVYMSCFSPDSRMLVSASKDTTCKVWDVVGNKGKMKEDLTGHQDEVFAVDWSGDGGKVGSGGADKQVRIWRH